VANLNFSASQLNDTPVIGDFEIVASWGANESMIIDVTLPATSLNRIPFTQSPGSVPVAGVVDPNKAPLQDLQQKLNTQLGTIAGIDTMPGPMLLDISGNHSQLGVLLETTNLETINAGPTVSQLYLQVPANRVRAVALPQVEWEPVTTPDPEPKFPNVFRFTDSGQAAQLGTNSVTLVPVSSHEVLTGIANCYATERASTIGGLFTMPFGIVSYVNLQKSASRFIISPSFRLIQPTFSTVRIYLQS
jgi:hypothetical protein